MLRGRYFGLTAAVSALLFLLPHYVSAGLPDVEKSKYHSNLSYVDIIANRKKLAISVKTSRVTFKILFSSVVDNIPATYNVSTVMSQRYWTIKFSGENKTLPLLFNSRFSALKSTLMSFPNGTLIKVYGKVSVAQQGKIRNYFIDVVDIEQIESTIVDKGADVDRGDYRTVDPMRLELRYPDYLGEKVKMTRAYKGVRNVPPRELASVGISMDGYFMLVMDGLDVPMIVSRNNETCVEAIVASKPGDRFTVYGTMETCEFQAGRIKKKFLYFGVALIERASSGSVGRSAPARPPVRVTESHPTTPPPPPAPPSKGASGGSNPPPAVYIPPKSSK